MFLVNIGAINDVMLYFVVDRLLAKVAETLEKARVNIHFWDILISVFSEIS